MFFTAALKARMSALEAENEKLRDECMQRDIELSNLQVRQGKSTIELHDATIKLVEALAARVKLLEERQFHAGT